MATPLTPATRERVSSAALQSVATSAAVLACLGGGYVVAWAFASTVHSRNFPWISARALGIAGYLSLTALVSFGLWMQHPWRLRLRLGHAETRLRLHAALGTATVGLVLGHLAFLATDRYAGVGWLGALVPGLSHYRRTAVALGVGALEVLVVVAVTARLAGRRWTRHWLGVHRFSLAAFALTWFHGVLAGTDTSVLRPIYVVTGSFIALLAVTRLFARRLDPGPGAVLLPAAATRSDKEDHLLAPRR